MDNNAQEQVLHLDLSATAGKKVVIDNDESRTFRINPSDFSIYDRLREGMSRLYDVLTSMKAKVGALAESEDSTESENENDDGDTFNDTLGEVMRDADAEMRSILDFIFNAPVADACAPDGYMFDLFDGQLRFEYIINALTKLYENNINAEFYKVKSRISAKLPDYVKNGKK